MSSSGPQRVVFIASLGHSGSTLLDLVLGGHERFIGLGEVANTITRDGVVGPAGRPACSCGRPAAACPFWSEVDARFRAEPDADFVRRYAIVFEAFTDLFGGDVTPVDSSKSRRHLDVLHRTRCFDLRVLFLLKDVRNFAISAIDNVARKRAEGQQREAVTAFGAFRGWHRTNRELRAYLDRERLPAFQFGYEEFCLAPERIARRLCEFLEVEFQPEMLRVRGSGSHALRGNRMRSQPEKAALSYDHRWFTRRDWLLPSLLCPRIMRFNREQVYSNGLAAAWER
jgi:hypothetical protein